MDFWLDRSRRNQRQIAIAAIVVVLLLSFMPTAAATIESIEGGRTHRVSRIVILGNKVFSDDELLAQMRTKQQPFHLIWKKPPKFDGDSFATDLKRLRRFYQAHGYYSADVDYELELKDRLVRVIIRVKENQPVTVQQIRVQLDDYEVPQDRRPYGQLGLKPGNVFTEESYRRGEEALRNFYRDAGYAHVAVRREARVNLAANQASVRYLIHPGVPAVFGATEVSGAKTVDQTIVLRELTYKPDEQFSQSKIDKSRDRILKLDLFAVVRFQPQLKNANPRIVPIKLVVRERPKHQIRIGGGYNTESQFIADLQWSHRNWLGGGRQLSILMAYSNINSTIAATLRQPYLFNLPNLTNVLNLRQDVQQVPTYTLFAPRLLPRLEYALSPELTAYFGYRIEYAKLTAVDATVVKALGGIRQSGIASGFDAGVTWNTADDLYSPHSGNSLKVEAKQGGGVFGGNFDFYRVDAEIKHYESIGWGTILATRLKLGTGDSLGSKSDYPLFERFYAGGEGSVRGYGYWRLGPKSPANVPLGGLSDIEGSIELRHQIRDKLAGALFFDFGQLSLHPYDLPVSSLRFAAGPAVSYMTPVGPLRVDVGIPFQKPRGDQAWQLYFSIGQFF